tara:strand:- start:1051 stop:1506 length:456 start_codon:yes stop_codon:yes gene_type:complete
MSINLVLNSRNSLEYANGVAKFFVNWGQFFDDDPYCRYNVSFSFTTEHDANLDQDDIFIVSLDNLGSTMRSITSIGQFGVGSTSSTAIGIVSPFNTTGAHVRLNSDYSNNPPVEIMGRPSENILQVSFRDLSNTITAKEPNFLLIIRFEKI